MRLVKTLDGRQFYVPEQSEGEVEAYVIYDPNGYYVGEIDLSPFVIANKDTEYIEYKRKLERMQLAGYIVEQKRGYNQSKQ